MATVTEPAWQRFEVMARETHSMLVGAAQCRNHLVSIIETWGDELDGELREALDEALLRLTQVGV